MSDRIPAELLEHARLLRSSQTHAEAMLWALLRNRRLGGYKFRRQVPRNGFILDFLCLERNLGIELDGDSHATDESAVTDRLRTVVLNRDGIRVIRFWNVDVTERIEAVAEAIWIALHDGAPVEFDP